MVVNLHTPMTLEGLSREDVSPVQPSKEQGEVHAKTRTAVSLCVAPGRNGHRNFFEGGMACNQDLFEEMTEETLRQIRARGLLGCVKN